MRAMTRDVAAAKPDAIAIICTNMRGAPLAEELEAAHGIPIYDTVVDHGVEEPEDRRRRYRGA